MAVSYRCRVSEDLAPTSPREVLLGFSLTFALLLIVVLLASYMRANRATNIDPMRTLREG